MSTQTTLKSMYNARLSSYSNYDLSWVQFIRDHYYHLKAGSTLVQLNPYRQNVLKYRLADFLKDNHIPSEMGWIILMVNQMSSETAFVDLHAMLIPSITEIERLRSVYNTVQSHITRVRNES